MRVALAPPALCFAAPAKDDLAIAGTSHCPAVAFATHSESEEQSAAEPDSAENSANPSYRAREASDE